MESRIFNRHFTREEANAVLPFIAPLLLRIRTALADLAQNREEVIKALQRQQTNGKPMDPKLVSLLDRLQSLTEEVESYGCIIKDHLNGIVDFPAMLDGEEVFLCWKYGEEEVCHYHPLDGGFDQRQPLP
ncbi:MAG: DUF2203 family protein [Armatimonadetes bacterium]|nr:MAG: DUF2203 family protein [Armatimonadota bacterium]